MGDLGSRTGLAVLPFKPRKRMLGAVFGVLCTALLVRAFSIGPSSGGPTRRLAPVSISPNGVVDAATLDPARGISGGSWVSIFGAGFAPSTRSWLAADFVDGQAPTSLDGVSVRINGKPAFVAFLMRGSDFGLAYDQVNVLTPDDPAVGDVPVEVFTPLGTAAATRARKVPLTPALFPFEPEGRKYLASITPDGAEFIAKETLFGARSLGRPVRPARTNEIISLFGSGFGLTNPPVPAGTVVKGLAPLARPVTVLFGTTPAKVEYAGLAPNLTGVYQFNVRVPDTPEGELEIVVQIDGVQTPLGRYLPVAVPPYPTFEHTAYSSFRLTGAHVFTGCTECHLRGKFAGTPTACAACHLPLYQAARNPDHVASGFPQDCGACHTTTRFFGAASHENTKFALTGAHAALSCAKCHESGRFSELPTACVSCHLSRYQSTANPNHAAAGYSTDCATCHTTAKFTGATVDHSRTKFALTGAHATLVCKSCHASGQYSGTPTACVGCHLSRFNSTTNPNHAAAGFPKDCTLCHTTSSFAGGKFDHVRTKLPLTGSHATLQCINCHTGSVYSGLSAECASCHLAKYNSAPNHSASGYPKDCALCHVTAQWKGAQISHARYALTGAHMKLACTQCHTDGRYAGTPRDCASCHTAKFNATTNPNHKAAGFSLDCALCHSTTQFPGGRFQHTRFVPAGAHTSLPCASCHASGTYAGTPADCAGCHTAKFNATTNPNHAASGYPKDCIQCHTTAAWKPASIAHTKFALTGKHLSLQCAQCHTSGIYAGTPSDCASCHTAKFNATTSPNHKAAGFPTSCAQCHTTAGWPGAKYTHTRFVPAGAHTSLPCASCHAAGTYAGTSAACVNCHLSKYNTGPTPNHAGLAYPKDCTLCHTTAAWKPANFTHKFPINSGTHSQRWSTCTACHVDAANFKVFSCLGCHTKESTDSEHRGRAGYSYDSLKCYSCHPTGK